jgi:CubicO group peptidase (beta-lactamase class C family)
MMRTAEDLLGEWPVDHAAFCASRFDGSDQICFGDVDHIFALASVTKLFTALVTHIAVEEGTVALGDTTPTGEAIDDLLAHASGLGPDGDILAAKRSRRIYSNAGYEQLAAEVQRGADMSFDDYWTEALAPLGVDSLVLEGSAAHGAFGSVTDVHLGLRALAEPGLISAETIAALRTPHCAQLTGVLPGFGRQSPNPWGLGPEIRGTKSPHWTGANNSEATYGHFGASGTFCWIDPVAGVALSALSDRPFGEWSTQHWPRLSDEVLGLYR